MHGSESWCVQRNARMRDCACACACACARLCARVQLPGTRVRVGGGMSGYAARASAPSVADGVVGPSGQPRRDEEPAAHREAASDNRG
eukprot:1422136-Pleurochrysis_carterae.AAC.1